MSKRSDKQVTKAAERFAEGQQKARQGNRSRSKASATKKAAAAKEERDRVARIAAARARFDGMSRYEILADLDGLRRDAIRGERLLDDEGELVSIKVNAKAVLDISKFLIEELDARPDRRVPESREKVLAEQKKRALGKAGATAPN